MNNEIGRKLTSLTLMTIMLAGGMVIGAPSMVPEAAAAGQLFVSAENANFNNYFAGSASRRNYCQRFKSQLKPMKDSNLSQQSK